MPARRATKDTLMPGCMASSTSRTFSAADHRRRRCTEVMTSNREIGPSEGVVIVVIIGLRLCLISYAECPVEKGGSSVVDNIVFSRLLYWNIVGNGSAIVFRKSAALEYGGYDARVTPTEDVMLQLKIASRYRVAVTPEYLVGYRQYTEQMSSNADLMYRSWMRTLELVREECEAVPECAINWKMGELHFASATRAYLEGRLGEATRLILLAGRSDPVGMLFELAAFIKQRVHQLAGRAKRALVPAGAPARRPPFLETRPDEFVPARKAVLRDRRLEYLRRLDEASVEHKRKAASNSRAGGGLR